MYSTSLSFFYAGKIAKMRNKPCKNCTNYFSLDSLDWRWTVDSVWYRVFWKLIRVHLQFNCCMSQCRFRGVVPFPNWKWLWETAFTSIQKHSSSEVRVAIRIITAFIALNFSLSFLVGFLFTTTTFLASWWSWSFRRFRSRCFHWCHRRTHERHSRHIWLRCSKNGRSYYGDVSWNWRFGNLIGSHGGSQSLLFVLFGRINFEHELLELDILFYQSLLTRHLQVST